jgi:HEAT repeat protein
VIRYCPHCWKETPLDAARCPHCGQSTDEKGLDFVDRLISALRHPEPTRAGLAIDILAEQLRELRAVEPLIELMRTTKDMSVLQQAARGLGILGDREAVPALAELLGDRKAPLVARREAAFALGKSGGPAAENSLLLACKDAHSPVADAAEQALFILSAEKSKTHGGKVKPGE